MKGTLKRLLIVLIAISMVIMPTTMGYAYADEEVSEAVSEEAADVAVEENGDAVEGPDLSDLQVPRLGEAEAAELAEQEEPEPVISGVITREELANMSEAQLKETVRVAIILSKPPVLSRYSVEKINSFTAKNYRKSLKNQQAKVVSEINQTLGKDINVKSNHTLAVNVISAEVTYGDIMTILDNKDVEGVQRENHYEAIPTDPGTADPKTAMTSEYMVGAQAAWADGYTGAGQRIAIIDTGADIEHQSFDSGAFDYAIAKYEEKFGKTVDLMDKADVDAVADQLNGHGIYLNSKMPYIYNYVDEDLDVTHVHDKEGEHGSHVAGIAAANRYIPDGDTYVDTLDGTYAVGMAPDAQILVMKVFGKGGGAYDGDYMDAIEDAMVMECDAVNLSLGTGSAGFTYDNVYQDALNTLVDSNMVAAISAGNSNDWAMENSPYGMLYADSVIYNTVGSPGSYINSLSVAAAQNIGATGAPLVFGGEKVFYTETTESGPKMADLDTSADGSGKEFDFVYIDSLGFAEQYADVNAALSLNGKVTLVNRGAISFVEKGNNPKPYNPAAILIVNNTNGSISMSTDGYTGNYPYISINGEDKETILASAVNSQEFTSKVTYDFDGDEEISREEKNVPYTYTVYTGKMTVTKAIKAEATGTREDATITSFSSWGVPESLVLKPDITAPGGNIYSVNGAAVSSSGANTGGHDKYELMSGTSMAAPHIAGLSGVIKQYLEENDLGEFNSELTDKYNLRAIAQSLMMSTATPMKNNGDYLPVIQQGAGLVDISKAINATSVVMIDEAFLTVATGGAADGKVKVELGEDGKKEGVYNYAFSIYNTTDEDEAFELDSDFFTQNLAYDDLFLDTAVRPLNVTVDYKWVADVAGLDEHDVDKDGDTDKLDAQAILDYLTGINDGSALDLAAGEMDEDGKLTTYDAHLLLGWKAGDLATNYIVPANGKAQVFVTVTLNEDLSEYPAGAYIEGFTYANCVTETEEGLSLETSHSIPVLGFYGNWSDSSMFDYTSKMDVYHYGEENVWPSYTGNISNYFVMKQGPREFVFTGNPYVPEEEIPYDRFAITSDTQIKKVYYTLLRNAATTGFAVSELNEEGDIDNVIAATIQNILVYGVYTDSQGVQQNTGVRNCTVGKSPADYGLAEGDLFRAGFYSIPEYNAMLYTANQGIGVDGMMISDKNGYLDTDEQLAGLIEEGTLGEGAYVGYDFVVDDTAPELGTVNFNAETGKVTIPVSDNEHLAFVGVISLDGSEFYAYEVPEEATATVELDLSNVMDDIPMYAAVFAGDYAGNEVAQVLKVNDNAADYDNPLAPAEVVLSSDEVYLYKGNSETIEAKLLPITAENTAVTWATSNASVATVEDGTITAVAKGQADITATSVADPTISSTCHVTVTSVKGELSAIAWDSNIEGNENESFISMGTDSASRIKAFNKMGDLKGISTTTAYYGLESGAVGVPTQLYSGTFDYSTGDAAIYKVDSSYNFIDNDTTTPELDPYGIGYWPLVDLAMAYPSARSGVDMAYVYGPYLVLGNSDPQYPAGIPDLASYTGKVGLPFIVGEHPDYATNETYWCAVALKGFDSEYAPEYYVMDQLGTLWDAKGVWTVDEDGNDDLQFEFTSLFNIGIEPGWLRQSMFYDDRTSTLYFSYTESGIGSTLYYIDLQNQRAIEIGDFGENVWPVTGLFNKADVGFRAAPANGTQFDADLSQNTAELEANMAKLNAFRAKGLDKNADGSTNAVTAQDRPRLADVTLPESIDTNPTIFDDGEVHMWLTEDVSVSNGLATIKYDPEFLTYIGQIETMIQDDQGEHKPTVLTSINNDPETGTITIAYADKKEIPYAIAALKFQAAHSCEPSEVVTTTSERNDEFDLEEVSTSYLTAHVWGEWEFNKEDEEFVRTCENCGATETQPFPYRVFGQSRYDTAMELADEVKAMFGDEPFESVIVATGDAFPDALTGSYLSIQNKAPILLINKQDKVKNAVIDYIGANAVEGAEVFILGGTGAVDAKFEADLKAKGYEVTRLAGDGRFETNLAILGEVEDPGTDLLVCSGLSWPDAATSSATGLPILIVGKELNADQKAYLAAQNFENIYVVGGTAVVSDAVLNSLKPYAAEVKRVAGDNRAATAIAVAEKFFPEGPANVVYAYQSNFPDCISGGLMAYMLGAPILYGPAYLDINKEYIQKCGVWGAPYALGGKGLVTTDFFLNVFDEYLEFSYGYVQ